MKHQDVFKEYNSIGAEEKQAALRVVRSGRLSGFVGSAGNFFLGGDEIRSFEEAVCNYTGSEYAVTVNSWSSGIYTMLKSVGVGSGDEVITVSWTMCATATAVLAAGAIPVFVDISHNDYNIDPLQIEAAIATNTKAVLAVDIFGYPCEYQKIRGICDRYGLVFITDSAQAWGSKYFDSHASTLADIGGFSLNRHKIINCGEGGVIVTSNPVYARRCQLIRNHGENALLDGQDLDCNRDILGFNFRMGEIEAAIASEQLKKLDSILLSRLEYISEINDFVSRIDLFRLPDYSDSCLCSYYKYPMRINREIYPLVERATVANILKENGLPFVQEGYVEISTLPCFSGIKSNNEAEPDAYLSRTRALHHCDFIGLAIDLIALDMDSVRTIKKSIDATALAIATVGV